MGGQYASTTQPSSLWTSKFLVLQPALAARAPVVRTSRSRGALLVTASGPANIEKAMLGDDFGARDPFAGEIESNFGDKVLGNYDTEHIIKPPEKISEIIGLKSKRCIPCEGGNVQKLEEKEVERLKKQVPGWKLATDKSGAQVIRCEWKVRNFAAGLQLFQRIAEVAEEQGHHPDLHLEGWNNVYVDLSTHAAGGLTENDFIMASKINELDFTDLQPKKKPKFWA